MHRYLTHLQSHLVEWEDLEAREMMSASPLHELAAPARELATVVATGRARATVMAEPATTGGSIRYASFAGDPLFSAAGPSPDDVRQGELGDCYLLATLSSLAKVNPALIRHDITPQADGTFSIAFHSGKQIIQEKVDTQLPVETDGTPAYAQLGASKSLWVALMEKAFAEFRNAANSYANISGGWMGEVFTALGVTSRSMAVPKTSQSLLSQLQADVKAHRATTLGTASTESADSALIADHAYSVDHVNLGTNGKPISVTLRNPWAVDGAGNDGTNDGYVTVTASQLTNAFSGIAVSMK